ncbi:MAG: DUF2029 domain-containing protein [Candidatus Hydrogenedentes bacterium]|nr:DUF2029 domain-containing protein [Candidatus Hydrogenedentota bacterium]
MGAAKATPGRRYGSIAFVLTAALNVLYMGNIKNRDHFIQDYDTRFWYTAGQCWLAGESPYNYTAFTETWTAHYGKPPRDGASFVYPPIMALISVPLALLPWPRAAHLFRLLNLLAYTAALYGIWRLFRKSLPPGAFWALAAATGFLASVTQTMVQGQIALLALLAIVLVLTGWRERRFWLYLAGFLLAAIKPQLTLLFLAYTVMMGGVAYGIVAGAVTATIATGVFFLWPVSQEALRLTLSHHTAIRMNHPAGYDSVPALIGETPLGNAAMLGGVLAGLACTAWIGWRYRVGHGVEAPSLPALQHHVLALVALTIAFLPAHRYDLAVHALFVLALVSLRSVLAQAGLLLLVLLHGRIYSVGGILHKIAGAPTAIDHDYWSGHASSMLSGVTLVLVLGILWRQRETGSSAGTVRP